MEDLLLHETKIHGTVDFPYTVYPGKIPEFMTDYPRHWHEEAELIYVTEGHLKVTVWSEGCILSPGDIVIVLPHEIHSIEQAGAERARYFNVIFNFSILGNDASADKYLKPFLNHEKTVNSFEPNPKARIRPITREQPMQRRKWETEMTLVMSVSNIP